MIIDDIKKVIAELEQEAQMPPINVELVDNELAMVYANSSRADVSVSVFSSCVVIVVFFCDLKKKNV